MKNNAENDASGEAWTAITARDYRNWKGLPAGLQISEVDAALPRLRDEYGIGKLGNTFRPAMFRMHVAEGYPFNLKVWFREERVVLIEMNHPRLSHPSQELLKGLGKPEDKLDYHLDVLPVAGGAWIYPKRGITVFLDVGLTEVMRIAVYPSCSRTEYLEQLHPSGQVREQPSRD